MNAQVEFINIVGTKEILCAIVSKEIWGEKNKIAILKIAHSKEEYNQFLQSLDYSYSNGYGGQEIFGTIWFVDGTWADRGEYDGSEWWEHHKCPEVPDNLMK